MKITSIEIIPYEMLLTTSTIRRGVHLKITDENNCCGWGEVAPLPNWSSETLEECLTQIDEITNQIKKIEWSLPIWDKLRELRLLPAVAFGLESALLSILDPLSTFNISSSCLLMGSPKIMLKQAKARIAEGYKTAKIKIGHLHCDEAYPIIENLRHCLRLRIDINRGWSNSISLEFFEKFPKDAFDYVEEPFNDPRELRLFKHPFAIDESFPSDVSLKVMDEMPALKAVIYKPTIQGGMTGCLDLHQWTRARNIQLVLSSSFESDLGLSQIACIAKRLDLLAEVGIGTYHYHDSIFQESAGQMTISSREHDCIV